MSEPNFESFKGKGGKLVTTKTASVTMNTHGNLNIPGSVREQIFDGNEYIEFHAAHQEGLLGLESHPEDDAPPHAYKISGGEGSSGTVPVKKVLEWVGKQLPDEHTFFELEFDDNVGMPYIDLAKLEDMDD